MGLIVKERERERERQRERERKEIVKVVKELDCFYLGKQFVNFFGV